MTVRAYWNQVLDRVDSVLFPDLTHRDSMVNVNKALADLAILFLKVKTTDLAATPVMLNAGIPGPTVSFIAIHKNLGSLSFAIGRSRRVFIGEHWSFF